MSYEHRSKEISCRNKIPLIISATGLKGSLISIAPVNLFAYNLRKKSEVFRLGKEYIPYNKVSISQFDEGNAIQIFDRLGTDRGVVVLKNGQPIVLGTFDVHLWYNYNDDSNILKQTVSYMNELDLVKKESRNFDENDELMVVCNREPKCISVNKTDENVLIEIEKEISLSVVGKTTMKVETKNEKESWDELDNITVDENFIK